jgi:hypothetical protein
MHSVSNTRRTSDATPLSGGLVFWLPSLYFVLHTLEELPGFALWVTRYFGPMSPVSFAWVHIPLLLLVIVASYQASTTMHQRGWAIFATAAMWQFALNALFHLTTAVLFNDYSPGMVTAGLALPVTVYFLKQVWREKHLRGRDMGFALVLGTVLAAAAIGVLFLH